MIVGKERNLNTYYIYNVLQSGYVKKYAAKPYLKYRRFLRDEF